MTAVIIVAIVFGSVLTLAALVCGTVVMLVKARQTGLSGTERKARAEEVRLIQELYHALSGLEQRIESLETILMDPRHKENK